MALRHPALVVVAVAILLLAPSLVIGTLTTHDSWLTGSWATQFSSLFRAGVLYPRWLPQSFDNLGGPIFYYTAPLAYWLDALVSAASANLLPDGYRLSVSSVLLLSASGLAMHGWLKTEVTSPRTALYGALAYMALSHFLSKLYPTAWQLGLGLLLVIIALFARNGICGLGEMVLRRIGR